MIYKTLGVKCSKKTPILLKELFEKNELFEFLSQNGISLNPSWFFKFSACVVINNLEKINNIKDDNLIDFSYNCHYVENFDNTLKRNLDFKEIMPKK